MKCVDEAGQQFFAVAQQDHIEKGSQRFRVCSQHRTATEHDWILIRALFAPDWNPLLLQQIQQHRIPIWSEQRSDQDPIVFGGGPVLTANPEPLAPFFDVILLGDGEELLPSFIDTLQEVRTESRSVRLRRLAQVPGIYVPSLYAPRYENDGCLQSIDPIEADLPPTISKQTWRGNSLSHSTVITPESAWPDIHMVEVVRSCPELCRFCLASYLTLPFRTPSLDDGLIPAVEKGLVATRRLGLLGASVTQHPQFADLLS